MIAQSTFFMKPEHGCSRLFKQWEDDEETIQTAIESYPVDCIHYIPYEELVKLDSEWRDHKYLFFKARLVSRAENGNTLSHAVGGANRFTAPQKISSDIKNAATAAPLEVAAIVWCTVQATILNTRKDINFVKKNSKSKSCPAARRRQ